MADHEEEQASRFESEGFVISRGDSLPIATDGDQVFVP